MTDSKEIVLKCAKDATSRLELWRCLLTTLQVQQMVEVGVFRGELAEYLLKQCPSLTTYYMIDPWRHLDQWNKPANVTNQQFNSIMKEALERTQFAHSKRVILRGTTAEMAGHILDESLDFAYIDGDHTLRGITIDLIQIFRKVRPGGWIGGDDFSPTIWQHGLRYEPTFVFPFAVYFAEAVGARIYALPFAQFLIEKSATSSFEFIDLVGRYGDTSVQRHCRLSQILSKTVRRVASPIFTTLRKRPAFR